MKTHLRIPELGQDRPRCGIAGARLFTDDPDEMTCHACERDRAVAARLDAKIAGAFHQVERQRTHRRICRNLLAAREAAGVGLGVAAAIAGVEVAMLVRWEEGDGEPDIIQAEDLADLYGVPLGALAEDSLPPPATSEEHGQEVDGDA